MNHLSTTKYTLEIREFEDELSPSLRAWIVDVLDMQGDCVVEGAGVAPTLVLALEEAGKNIALEIADDWLVRAGN